MAWLTPLLWPFLRVLALFRRCRCWASAPCRCACASRWRSSSPSPRRPRCRRCPPCALDSPLALLLVVQQVLIGLALGFAVRIVFAAVEFAGELIGLQMGLNFAGFFDPASGAQTTAASRFFGTMVALLFIVDQRPPAGDRRAGAELPRLPGRHRAVRLPAHAAAAGLGRRGLPARAVDRAAAGRHAAVRQPRARRRSRAWRRRSTSSRSAFRSRWRSA